METLFLSPSLPFLQHTHYGLQLLSHAQVERLLRGSNNFQCSYVTEILVYLMLVHHSWFATSSLHSCSISGYFLKMSATVV